MPETELQSGPLGGRQELFVNAYFGEAKGEAKEAARIAGYANPRMSGSRLLSHPRIAAAIRRRTLRAAMSADECLSRLASIAGADLSDCLDIETTDGRSSARLNVARLVESGRGHLIREFKVGPFGYIESVKVHDSLAALQTIAKHLGLLRDQVDVTVTEDTETIRARIMQKLARPGSN